MLPNGTTPHDTPTDQAIATQAPPAPATADAFRRLRATPEALTLPASGLTVHVRRVHLAELALSGAMPDHLTARVLERIGIKAGRERPDTPDELRRRLAENVELADAVCCAVLVSPRMFPAGDGEEPAAGAITPEDMPYQDREHVFLWACGLVQEASARAARFPDPITG